MSVTLPLYRTIYDKLSQLIAQGSLKPGDQLPSQRALSVHYEASHMTVRRAIDALLNDGLIIAIPGKGLYVAAPKQDAESGPLVSFSEDMARRGMRSTTQVLAAELAAASASEAQLLQIAIGAPVVSLKRLRFADDRPMAIQHSVLPHALCPGLLTYDLAQHSLFALLRQQYGLHLAYGTTVAEAALADAEQAQLLALRLPAALLITEQCTYLPDGRPLEFVRSAYAGQHYRLRQNTSLY
jgi:GntR family transcriptional regulator